EKALPELGKQGGFDVTIRSDGRETAGPPTPEEVAKWDFSFLTPEYLAQFDGLLMFTNGNLPLTVAQKRNLIEYSRGNIRIIDLEGLEDASCSCYQVAKFPIT
ncbi:MAG: hypothetical protein ABI648_09265, partial [Betaproteobacteria bacterium]